MNINPAKGDKVGFIDNDSNNLRVEKGEGSKSYVSDQSSKSTKVIELKQKKITERAVTTSDQSLKINEVVQMKQKELIERAFTTFCLENWDEAEIDSLAELGRETDVKFTPYSDYTTGQERMETDSYSASTSFIRRVFVEKCPDTGFKKLETVFNPYSDDGSLIEHPLVKSVLSSISELLSGELRPKQDRIEVSLIRQCANKMPELTFHTDNKRQVFVLVLACNFKESDGAEMSVKDGTKVLTEEDLLHYKKYGLRLPPAVENANYYHSNMPSVKGNGYLIRETRDNDSSYRYMEHRRGAYSTEAENPERITLRILIDDQDSRFSEAI